MTKKAAWLYAYGRLTHFDNGTGNMRLWASPLHAATQKVWASAQEKSAQVEEIASSSQSLKDMAAHLRSSVSVFKL